METLHLLHAGAVALVMVLGVAYARSGTLKEQQARELGLRLKVAPVNAVDPMRVGVAVPAPAQRELTTEYLPRGRDGDLNSAMRAALSPRATQWR